MLMLHLHCWCIRLLTCRRWTSLSVDSLYFLKKIYKSTSYSSLAYVRQSIRHTINQNTLQRIRQNSTQERERPIGFPIPPYADVWSRPSFKFALLNYYLIAQIFMKTNMYNRILDSTYPSYPSYTSYLPPYKYELK